MKTCHGELCHLSKISYPQSTQVALIGLEQMNDRELRQYAINNDFVIATKDADFYEMNLLYGQPPKIIWLKMGNQKPQPSMR